LLKPASDAYKAHQKNKLAKIEAKATIDEILTNAAASNSEIAGKIALFRAQNEGTTWKDEYALIVITAPYVLSMVMGVVGQFTDIDAAVVIEAIFAPMEAVPEYWKESFRLAIGAALGINVWQKVKKG
jgi:hypothetical protein